MTETIQDTVAVTKEVKPRRKYESGGPLKINYGWNALHQRILTMTIHGKSSSEICSRMQVDPSSLSFFRKTPLYLEKFEHQSKSVIQRVQKTFENSAEQAAKKVCRLMRKGKTEDRVQLEASRDILDRIGYKPVQIIDDRRRSYTPQEVESAKGTLRELEDTLVRLERKDSIFVLKRSKSEVPPKADKPVDAGPIPTSADRPEAVSA